MSYNVLLDEREFLAIKLERHIRYSSSMETGNIPYIQRKLVNLSQCFGNYVYNERGQRSTIFTRISALDDELFPISRPKKERELRFNSQTEPITNILIHLGGFSSLSISFLAVYALLMER